MFGKPYVVVAGDCLWTIAKTHLGSGTQWPRIYRYNNRREVIRVNGRGIDDPDLIYVNQRLLLPVVDEATPARSTGRPPPVDLPRAGTPAASAAAASAGPSGPLAQDLPKPMTPLHLKFNLGQLTFPPLITPTAIMEMKMSGDLILKHSKRLPPIYVVDGTTLEAQATQELNTAFGKLISDNRVFYNPTTNSVSLRSMIVSQSTDPDMPATAIGVVVASDSLVPKLRAEIRLPKIEGRLGDIEYVGVDVKVIIEITPLPPPSQTAPSPQPVRVAEPATNWPRAVGIGLVATAAVIAVATIVEDIVCPVGVADDPASLGAAGAMLARGLTMIKGAAAALPEALAPAAVTLQVGLEVAH